MASPQSPRGDLANTVIPLWINGQEETVRTILLLFQNLWNPVPEVLEQFILTRSNIKQTSSSFEVISPSNSEVCWTATSATKEDALRAIASAEAAFPSWYETKPVARRDMLLKAATLLEERTQEYAGFMQTEMGAEMGVAAFFVMPLAIQMLKDIAGRITSICGRVPVCQEKGMSAIVFKEPYGVTLGIVPWWVYLKSSKGRNRSNVSRNAPFVFGIRSAATAIATGNTTILKASEVTPRSYVSSHLTIFWIPTDPSFFQWAISKAFHDAGLPAGVLNVIQVRTADAAEVTNTIIEHPAVKKIDFTGSANVGRKIARTCGQNLKPCLMELGGKNSVIVLPDADIEKAVGATIAGSFINVSLNINLITSTTILIT